MNDINCCIFCCKPPSISTNSESLQERGGQLVKRFFTVVQRFGGGAVGVTELLGKSDWNGVQTDDFQLCRDCSESVNSFCSAFHELKCLEMRLEWNLRKVSEVIKCADKVPSRMHSLKQFCWDEEVYKHVRKFRRRLRKKFSRILRRATPRVLLGKRVDEWKRNQGQDKGKDMEPAKITEETAALDTGKHSQHVAVDDSVSSKPDLMKDDFGSEVGDNIQKLKLDPDQHEFKSERCDTGNVLLEPDQGVIEDTNASVPLVEAIFYPQSSQLGPYESSYVTTGEMVTVKQEYLVEDEWVGIPVISSVASLAVKNCSDIENGERSDVEEDVVCDNEDDEDWNWTPQARVKPPNKMFVRKRRSLAFSNNLKVSPPTLGIPIVHPEVSHRRGRGRPRKYWMITGKATCDICGKVYSSQITLRQHKMLHDNAESRPFSCYVCGMGFPRRDYLSSHLRQQHTIGREGVNKCPEPDCAVTFATSKHLEHHMSSEHSGSPKFKCESCGEEFYLRYTLTRHEAYHEKGLRPPPFVSPPYTPFPPGVIKRGRGRPRKNFGAPVAAVPKTRIPCPLCGKLYLGSLSLMKHLEVTHARIPQHTCRFCGTQFLRPYMLNLHLAQNHNVMPRSVRKCEVGGCGKLFYDNNQFKVHMAKHEKKPGFKCEQCGCGFYHKHHLQRHQQNGHRIRKPGRKPKGAGEVGVLQTVVKCEEPEAETELTMKINYELH